MKKLGKIGIENIPALKREDLFKLNLPLSKELCEAVKDTPYSKEDNIPKNIVMNLFANGGDVFLSEEAKNEYGQHQVHIAYDYLLKLTHSTSLQEEEKLSIMSWIADNIFDLEKMKLEDKAEE